MFVQLRQGPNFSIRGDSFFGGGAFRLRTKNRLQLKCRAPSFQKQNGQADSVKETLAAPAQLAQTAEESYCLHLACEAPPYSPDRG